LKDKGVIDSGCSRHMTENMSYLSDFEELNGGYVAFGGNPKGVTLILGTTALIGLIALMGTSLDIGFRMAVLELAVGIKVSTC
nr:putative ribonuclease H-like domain-containing protein [Tanacetum cinerariifolium]